MGFWGDFLPVLNQSKLKFVQKRHETGDIYSFSFRGEPQVKWKAGQHGILTLPAPLAGRRWRAFSLASRPAEDLVRIATRVPAQASPYKQALMALKPDALVTMRGPFGPFYFDESRRPAVFVAGGIGITPFRALVMEAVHNLSLAPSSIRLLYADNRAEYCFKSELDSAAEQNPHLQVRYLDAATLETALVQAHAEFGNKATYFVSGSVAMVRAITKSLRSRGVANSNIRHDMFFGL